MIVVSLSYFSSKQAILGNTNLSVTPIIFNFGFLKISYYERNLLTVYYKEIVLGAKCSTPHLDIVAGDTQVTSLVSKNIFIFVFNLIRSPEERHKIFESSKDVFKFSTQQESTGPSYTINYKLKVNILHIVVYKIRSGS